MKPTKTNKQVFQILRLLRILITVLVGVRFNLNTAARNQTENDLRSIENTHYVIKNEVNNIILVSEVQGFSHR